MTSPKGQKLAPATVIFPLRNIWKSCVGLICFALLAALPAMLFWPVDMLTIQDDKGQNVLRVAMLPGNTFATCYIHSVQLSPVVEEYFVQEGLIWLWRAHVQGQNAGLPTQAPTRGHMYFNEPWVVFEGALNSFSSYALRVGNEKFGRNHLRIGQGPWQALYQTLPNKRLHLSSSRGILYKL